VYSRTAMKYSFSRLIYCGAFLLLTRDHGLSTRTYCFNQSINHNFKWTNAKALQSLYINMGRHYVPGNDSEKKVSFKFLFKCRQCHWWRHFWRKTVPGFCRRNTERSITDYLKTCLWHSKIRWWRRTQTLSTWKIGDMATCLLCNYVYKWWRVYYANIVVESMLNHNRAWCSVCARVQLAKSQQEMETLRLENARLKEFLNQVTEHVHFILKHRLIVDDELRWKSVCSQRISETIFLEIKLMGPTPKK